MGPSVDQRLLKNKISEPKDLAISNGNFKRKKMEQNIQELWDNYKKSTTYDNVIPPAEQGVNK